MIPTLKINDLKIAVCACGAFELLPVVGKSWVVCGKCRTVYDGCELHNLHFGEQEINILEQIDYKKRQR